MKRRVFLASMLAGTLGGRTHRSHGAQLRQSAVRIGFMQPVLTLRTPFWRPFFTSLSGLGWRERADYVLEERETLGEPARAREAAKDLVRRRVGLIVAISTAPAVAAREVTRSIPILTWCGYPVEAGLATSLSRPGGNVTGVANYAGGEVWGKFVALLRELRPELGQLGILWDYTPPAFPDGLVPLPYIESSARQSGIQTRIWMTRTEADLIEALSEIDADPVGALVISSGGGVHMRPAVQERIAALIARRRLPAITDIASTTVFGGAGCMLAYSPDVAEILGRLALFVHRILRGTSPAELPFELPSRFDLAVNARRAKALGLTLPQTILLRADRVID